MRQRIDEVDLISDYQELKLAAKELATNKNYEESLKLIEGCAKIAYEFNFVENFVDEELEELLLVNSEGILPIVNTFETNAKSVLFYDYFAIDNRGLTQQYLQALIDLKYDVTFIISNDLYYGESHAIIKTLKNYKNSRLVIYSNKLSFSQRTYKLNALLQEVRPAFVILHLSPWDVLACSIFQRYKFVKRIFINITDHAFWLGKNCIDVCIEFRNYGYQISKELRNIDTDKLFLLPYYPITQNLESFKGFGFDITKKVIGISGGSGYKFIGDNWKFYSLVKQLIQSNKDFVFILVGLSGRAKEAFLEKINQDKISAQFKLIDARYDIFQLIKHSDIFIGSYPFPGALMTQLAAIAGKPILTLNNTNYIFSFIDDVLPFKNEKFKSITSEAEFIKIGNSLIANAKYRSEYAFLTSNAIISLSDFNKGFQSIIEENKHYEYQMFEKLNFWNLSKIMCAWYLEIENEVNSKYKEILLQYTSIISRINSQSGIIKKYTKSKSSYIPFNNSIQLLKTKIKHFVKSQIIKSNSSQNFNDLKFLSRGSNINVEGSFGVVNPQFIRIGNNFWSSYNLRIEVFDWFKGERFYPELIIGDNVIFNTDCHIGCINKVFIGNNVLIASKVFISDHSHGNVSRTALTLPPSERPLVSKGPVIIEDNVWIGEGVCILPGVRIGHSAIIGANSVVTKDVPSKTVVAGNPARILKSLS